MVQKLYGIIIKPSALRKFKVTQKKRNFAL